MGKTVWIMSWGPYKMNVNASCIEIRFMIDNHHRSEYSTHGERCKKPTE